MYKEFPKDAIIVQKYGGTSVGTPDRIGKVAERTVRHMQEGRTRLAVVVSAMAGETNRLVDLVKQVNPRTRSKIHDMAISAGEQVAVALTAAAIEKLGVTAEPMLGFQLGIFTDSLHAKARIRNIDTTKILRCWEAGSVPVIAGFQGVTGDNEITTLGRGGSDTSAVALAVALKASFCEINTDVDGVFTADPRDVANARLCPKMDFNVALEMASLGSKVLHHRCVELAAKYHLPLTVRNTFKDDETQRTIIMALDPKEALEAPVVSGVTVDKNVAKVSVEGIERKDSKQIANLFAELSGSGINVDVIVHNRSSDDKTMRIGFTVADGDLDHAVDAVWKCKTKPGFSDIQCETRKNLAKVSVVGLGMISHHGVAFRAFQALTSRGIEIEMISTSEIKISCVIDRDRTKEAAEALHREFIESI
jgi:aspartate kinase